MSGTQPSFKTVKFRFDLLVDKLELRLSFPCSLSIIWSRGGNKIESKSKIELTPPNSKAAINETLSLLTAMKYDEVKQQFTEKKSTVTIVMNTSKGPKVAGVINLELSEYVNSKSLCQPQKVHLSKCPDANACLSFQIKTNYIGEAKDLDASSVSSLEIEAPEELSTSTCQLFTGKILEPSISDDVSQERRHKYGSPNPSPKDLSTQIIETQKVFELNDFVAALKTQLYVAESEKEGLAEKLRQEVEKFLMWEESKQREFKVLKEKIRTLEDDAFESNKSHQQELKELREKLSEAEKNNKNLDSQLVERRVSFQKVNETKNSLSIQLLSQKSVYDQKIETIQEELNLALKEKEKLCRELTDVKKLYEEKVAYESDIAPKFKELQEKIQILSSFNQEGKDPTALLGKLKDCEAMKENLERQLKMLQRETESQNATIDSLTKSNKELRAHVSNLENSFESLKSRKAEADKIFAGLKARIEELDHANFDLNINLSILKEENQILQEIADKNTREIQCLSSENTNLIAGVKEREELIQQLRAALVVAGERMHSSENKLEDNNSAFSGYQSEIKELKKEMMRLLGERNALEESVADLEARLKESLEALKMQSTQIGSMNEEIEEMLLRNTEETSKLNQTVLDLELRLEEALTQIRELERDKAMIQSDLNSAQKDITTKQLFYESELELYKKEEANWADKIEKMGELERELAKQMELSEEKDWKLRELKLLLRSLENKLQEDTSKFQREAASLIAQREREGEVLMQKENRLAVVEAEAHNYKSLSEKLASVIEDNFKTIQDFREGKKALLLDIKRKEAFINHLIEGFKLCQHEGEERWLSYIKDFTHSGPELTELRIDNRSEGVLKGRKNEEKRSSTKENEDHVNYKEKYITLEESFHLMEAELARMKISTDNKDVEVNLRLDIQKITHKNKNLENLVESLENDLVRTKQKLGDLINAVMEHGGPVFADKICSGYM